MLIQRSQSGLALLIFVVVVFGASLAALSGVLTKSVSQQEQAKKNKNLKRLTEAKEALLSYSVDYLLLGNDVGDMGNLPCPDKDGGSASNGSSDLTCGSTGVNSFGYFPYKSVGLGKIIDSSNECLWYVVSGNYKNVASADYGLRNWDSNGFLKVVDENGNLQHGSDLEDYPIALLISPSKNINQDRSPVANLSDCHANYSIDEYLEFFEGGVQKKYSDTLTHAADTEWTFLQSSTASSLEDVNYNDQIIAIYKNEFWDRVKLAQDLDTTNPNAAIEDLTQGLNQCLRSYMWEKDGVNTFRSNAFYPADLDLADYAEKNLYINTDSSKRYGRFPENIASSEVDDSTASVAAGGSSITSGSPTSFVTSYCVTEGALTAAQVKLWENWKDHFFVVIGDSFMPGNTALFGDKCTTIDNCLQIGAKTVAAIVFFSEQANIGQDRTLSGLSSDQDIWDQYLDGGNQTLYEGTDLTNDFDLLNDYTYCITYSSPSLTAEKC